MFFFDWQHLLPLARSGCKKPNIRLANVNINKLSLIGPNIQLIFSEDG